MKSILKFLIFVFYTSIVFFLPNNNFIFIFLITNFLIMCIVKANIKKVLKNILNIMPFILFTFVINILLDNLQNACWIGLKLIIVCNITFIYSQKASIREISKTIQILCSPLKIMHINNEEIGTMVAIALSMIPIIKRELQELKDACIAKNIDINLKNIKIILSKFILNLLRRVNKIDEALIEKGCDYE